MSSRSYLSLMNDMLTAVVRSETEGVTPAGSSDKVLNLGVREKRPRSGGEVESRIDRGLLGGKRGQKSAQKVDRLVQLKHNFVMSIHRGGSQ
jgi:hypothetical protein